MHSARGIYTYRGVAVVYEVRVQGHDLHERETLVQ